MFGQNNHKVKEKKSFPVHLQVTSRINDKIRSETKLFHFSALGFNEKTLFSSGTVTIRFWGEGRGHNWNQM